jgi:DNA-binding IclR family transcriptional regulator
LAAADLQDRTPALLAAVLAEWPIVAAAMAKKITGTNRATVQRNLAIMLERGLIREATGQGRYRVWTAKV